MATLVSKQLARRPDDQVVPALLALLPNANSEGRQRLLKALEARSDRLIAPALLAIIDAGHGDRAMLDRLLLEDEAIVRPGLIAVLDNEVSGGAKLALSGLENFRGPDVTAALVRVLEREPRTDEAFEQLVRQSEEDRVTPMIRLLTREGHIDRRPTILRALSRSKDPELASSTVKVTLADPSLAPLALDVLAHQETGLATNGLSALARADGISDAERAQAIRLLSQIAPENAVEQIRPLAHAESVEVRMAARNTLHDLEPETFPAWDPYGRIPLVLEGGAFGAGMLLIASQIADARLSPAFTAGAGAVLGAATPFLLTRKEDVSLGDAGYFGTTALWGTLAGWGFGGVAGFSERDTRWATLAGEIIGVTAGMATLRDVEWGLGEVALANFTAIEASATAAAMTSLIGSQSFIDQRGPGYAAMLAGGLTTLPLALFGRQLQVRDDLGLVLAAMAHGAWIGAWAPATLSKDAGGEQAFYGAAAGQGFGFLGGLMLAQVVDLSRDQLIGSGFGAALGATIGGGLGMSVKSWNGTPTHYGLIEAGSAVGAITLGLLTEKLQISGNDALLIALGTIGGSLAMARIEVRAAEDGFQDPTFAGNVLLGAGLGTAGGLLLSQLVDASNESIYRSLIAGALFGASGSGFARLLELEVRQRSLITGLSLSSGILLTAPFADRLDLSPPNLGMAAVASLAGGLWSAYLPVYWHDQDTPLPGNQIGAGALFGSTFSAAGMLALGQFVEFETRDVALASGGVLVGSAIGAGLGRMIPGLDRRAETLLFQGVGLAGLAAATIAGASRSGPSKSDLAPSDLVGHTGLFTLYGAWHGALLPYAFDKNATERQRQGGLLFGAGAGALAGYASARLVDQPLAGSDLVEAALLSVAANGVGAGVGLIADDTQLTAALIDGVGVGGLIGAMLIAPQTSYQANDAIAITSSILSLGWFGGWLPVALNAADRVGAGALLGSSLGVLGGVAYSQLVDEREEGEVLAFTAAGSAIGAGAGLLAQTPNEPNTARWIEGVGVAALGAGLALSPYTRYDAGDFSLMAAATSLGGLYGGLTLGAFEEDPEQRRFAGAALIGGSAGFLGSAVLSQFMTVEPADVFEAVLLGQTAGAVGLGAALATNPSSTRLAGGAYELASLGGLAAASLLAASTEYQMLDYSLIFMTSAAGAIHGGLATAIWSEDDRTIGGGALLGASAGLLAGVALSQGLELQMEDQLEAVLFDGAGTAIGGGLALLAGDLSVPAERALIDGAGLAAFATGLALSSGTNYSAADRGLMLYSTAFASWHGAWAGAMIAPQNQRDRGAAGGALLGSGAGFLAAAALSGATEVSADRMQESIATWSYGSAIGGGIGLALRDQLDEKASIGLLEAGGTAGLVGGLILADLTDFSSGDLQLIGLSTMIGAWHGSTLPVLMAGEDATAESRIGGALLGAGVLGLGAHILSQYTDYQTTDVGEILLAASLGNAVGAGLGLMIPDADARLRLGLVDGLGLGAAFASLLFAEQFAVAEKDVLDYSLFAVMGAGLGGLAPALWNGPELSETPREQVSGGLLVGAGLGLATAAVLTKPLELDGARRGAIAVGALAGSLTGGGLGLALSRDDRVAAGLVQGLMLAGGIGVGATADPIALDPGAMAVGATYVGYLTWHQLGVSLLLDGTDREAAGATMATVGIGALTGIYLVPKLHLKMDQTLMLFAGSVWGSWIGGWGGAMLQDGLQNIEGRRSTGLLLLSTVLGSDIGLGLTSLVVSGLFDVEPSRFAVINLCGLGGMMVGMLAAGFAKEEPLKAGNVIGSLGGLLAGAIVTSFFDFSEAPSPYDAPQAAEKSEARADNNDSFPISIDHWMPSATVEPTEHGERYMISIVGLWN